MRHETICVTPARRRVTVTIRLTIETTKERNEQTDTEIREAVKASLQDPQWYKHAFCVDHEHDPLFIVPDLTTEVP